MDLFDQLSEVRRQQDYNFGPAESFAGLIMVAIAADGYISEEESNLFSATLSRMKLFKGYSSDVRLRMIDKMTSILRRQGVKALLTMSLEGLPYHLYETAFAIATDIVLSDGEITEEEEELLRYLYNSLSIPKEIANSIIEVMIIKNKG